MIAILRMRRRRFWTAEARRCWWHLRRGHVGNHETNMWRALMRAEGMFDE